MGQEIMATKKQIIYGNDLRKQMKASANAMQAISELNLAKISEQMISDIMKAKKSLPEDQSYKATDDIKAKEVQSYKKEMDIVIAEIIEESWAIAQDYIGVKSTIKFKSAFAKLPKKVRDRITKTSELLIGAQVADLEKNLYFTYDDSIFSDLPDKEIISKLEDSAENYYTGSSITGGSAKIGAQYVNHSVNAYYALDEVSKELEAFQFYNPDPKSAICTFLAGQYVPKNDPKFDEYTPPLHWNCKSTWIPILSGQLPDGAEIEKIKITNKKALDSVQFSSNHNILNFLKRSYSFERL